MTLSTRFVNLRDRRRGEAGNSGAKIASVHSSIHYILVNKPQAIAFSVYRLARNLKIHIIIAQYQCTFRLVGRQEPASVSNSHRCVGPSGAAHDLWRAMQGRDPSLRCLRSVVQELRHHMGRSGSSNGCFEM